MMSKAAYTLFISVILTFLVSGSISDSYQKPDRSGDEGYIRPSTSNPYYWNYKGEHLLLVGGSWQDNLFNHPQNLKEHLDLLSSVGGNYVRNVMSHRNAGNVFAYARDSEGYFDLDDFNEEYWKRFESFLKLTYERDIIVQLEIWATWDHYADHQSLGGWSYHPFNPVNNSTYTMEEAGLPGVVDYEPGGEPTAHPFFLSVPDLENNELILRYQTEFVDKMFSYTLQYPHILYCMNNETGEHVEWGDYWAEHVHKRAAEAEVPVYVTDMRRSEDIRSDDHAHIYDNPEVYTYLDISQNNAWTGLGQDHYDRIIYVRDHISGHPRPINNIKNYGAVRHGEEESVARIARIIFAGSAGARFHRPHPLEETAGHLAETEWGLGLSLRSQQVIQSLRLATDELDIWLTEPRNDLLGDRDENEAYLLAEPGRQYAIYFPDGGSVLLDLDEGEEEYHYRWINLDEGKWRDVKSLTAQENVRFQTPGSGHWIVVILADDRKKEWVSLFNGENLDCWDVKISGYELNDNFGETFRVEDGLLKVRYDQYDSFDGRIGHIFYEEPFSHYRLQVEYRFAGEQVEGGPGWGFRNNGMMFHAQSAESMELDQNFPRSIEMQLLGGVGENERANGNIFTPGTQVVVDGELRTESLINAGGPTFHGDQWIKAEVVVYGDSLAQHILNEELVIEYTDLQLEDGTPLSKGHIALQAESHPTDFRSVRILNLEGCMDENALNYKSYYVQSDPEACEY
jgi:hypothetical protein